MKIKNKILGKVEKYKNDIIDFARDLIRIPGISCKEKDVVNRIKQEMDLCEFDNIIIDDLGNIIGRIGNGNTKIAIDAHIDTVDVGDISKWVPLPFEGIIKDEILYGRGAADQKTALASMVYAGKIIKELNLENDITLYIVGSVQEEDCEGMNWQYMLNKKSIEKPDYVIITEATNLNLHLGHRGRLEIEIEVFGETCHSSAPERGSNAIEKMSLIIPEIVNLNKELNNKNKDSFLGSGSVAVIKIDSDSPSFNAIPEKCKIILDRRLTEGETKEQAVSEIENIIEKCKVKPAKIKIPIYSDRSYKNTEYKVEKYFPAWKIEPTDKLTQSCIKVYSELFNKQAVLDKWIFATNGVATKGMYNIPTIGFGPGNEIHAHTYNDQVPVSDLLKSTIFYSYLPRIVG